MFRIKIAAMPGLDIKKMVDDWNMLHHILHWVTEEPIWLLPYEHARFLRANEQGAIEYILTLDLERDEYRVYLRINTVAGITVLERYSVD